MQQNDWAQLIEDLCSSDDTDRMVGASRLIAQIADQSHVAELYTLLQNDDFFVRETAAEPLARIEGLKALPMLFKAFTHGIQQGHDNDVLSHTIIELLETHKAAAAPLLLDMLAAADSETRANTAWGFGFVASEMTADPLLAMLADPDVTVQSTAIGSLGSFDHDPRVVTALLQALVDANEQIRIASISALGYLGDPRAIEPLKRLHLNANDKSRNIIEYALKQLSG